MSRVIEAALVWTGERFERGIQLEVSDEGRIVRAGALGLSPAEKFGSCALIPGMLNGHSHAFQRALRGLGERFPEGEGSFWSWRDAMYRLAEGIDEKSFLRLSGQAFREMLAGGITCVGEFHYFHHDLNSANYRYDELILDAAAEAGIRIVLLNVYYTQGGIGQPLRGAQQRFDGQSLRHFWQQMERLATLIDPRTQTLGVAAHSIRGVSLDEIAELYAEASRRGMPFHMHVEEQKKEIEESLAAFGKTPLALINERLQISERFTAVHCTHSRGEDLELFLEAGGNVCLTPLTEANLGDGIPRPRLLTSHRGQLSLGTDSNARISMIEEMRWLEYAQRLSRETRGVFRDQEGRVARPLFEIATRGGARCLGVRAGTLEPGAQADFALVDLGAEALAGCEEETLLEGIVFGTSESIIVATAVGGRGVLRAGERSDMS